jgi:hypothetical protein
MGAAVPLFVCAFVLSISTVAFIGTVAVAPRVYSVRKRISVGCGIVALITVIAALFALALVYRL